MNLSPGLLDNSLSLMLFLLDPLTSAFIKADLRRQKANKETPENVCMWALAGLTSGSLAEDGAAWVGAGELPSSHAHKLDTSLPCGCFSTAFLRLLLSFLGSSPASFSPGLPALVLRACHRGHSLLSSTHPFLPRLLSPVLGPWLRCFQPGVSAGQER